MDDLHIQEKKGKNNKQGKGWTEGRKEAEEGIFLLSPQAPPKNLLCFSWVGRRINWCLGKQFSFLNGSYSYKTGALWDNKFICVKLPLNLFLSCKITSPVGQGIRNWYFISCWPSTELLLAMAAEATTVCFEFQILSLESWSVTLMVGLWFLRQLITQKG